MQCFFVHFHSLFWMNMLCFHEKKGDCESSSLTVTLLQLYCVKMYLSSVYTLSSQWVTSYVRINTSPFMKWSTLFSELGNLCYQPKGHYIGSLRVIVIALSLKHWSKAQVELHSEHNNRKASLREHMSSYQNKSRKSCQSFCRFTFYWPHKQIRNLQISRPRKVV